MDEENHEKRRCESGDDGDTSPEKADRVDEGRELDVPREPVGGDVGENDPEERDEGVPDVADEVTIVGLEGDDPGQDVATMKYGPTGQPARGPEIGVRVQPSACVGAS